MEFEFDDIKSDINESKHGISFAEALDLWCDLDRMEIELEHRGEQRYLLVAHYEGTLWAAIYTLRVGVVRIISVRRATENEVSYYDKNRNSRR